MYMRFASLKVTRMEARESSELSSEWEMRRDGMDSACRNMKEEGTKEIDGGEFGNRGFVFVYFWCFTLFLKMGEIQACS